MSAGPHLRRTFLIGSAACLVGFEPTPVRFRVENRTAKTIAVRIDDDEPWQDVPPGEVATLATYPHAGLCQPPERWLPESFTGFHVRRGGEVERVDRTAFEARGVWGRGPSWTFAVREDARAGQAR